MALICYTFKETLTVLPTFHIFREFYKTVSQDDDAQDDEPNGFYAGKFVFGFLVENTTKYLSKVELRLR